MANFPVTLILGGARSGKSSFAEKLALKSEKKPFYIATAEARDDEMVRRINQHQSRRDERWLTIEEPLKIDEIIDQRAHPENILVVDCLTLWLSNIMCRDNNVMTHIIGLVSCLENIKGPIIFVANEVGLGIVPENDLARAFRDEAGRLNKAVASVASDVIFMAAGLPMAMKKSGKMVSEYL